MTIKYHIYVYIFAILLVSLQFLQVFQASVFYRDDLVQLVKYSNSNNVKTEILSRPSKVAFWFICTKLKNPILVRFFIISLVLIGTVSFIFLCSQLQIDPLLSLLAINLHMSFWFNAEAVYYAAGSWAVFCWTFSLLSIVLFLVSYRTHNTLTRFFILFASIISYWIAVTRNPQHLLFPVMVLLFIYPGFKSHMNIIKEENNKNRLLSLIVVMAYFISTVVLFLIRWLVFKIEIHNYMKHPMKHFTINFNNISTQLTLFINTVESAFSFSYLQNKIAPSFGFYFLVIITLGLYIIFWYLNERKIVKDTPLNISNERQKDTLKKENTERYLLILLLFCTGFLLSSITNLSMVHNSNRYFFSSSFYLVMFIPYAIYFTFQLFSKSGELLKITKHVFYIIFILLLLLSSYNRYVFIDFEYTPKAKYYSNFKKLMHQEIKISQFHDQSQFIIIGHPAYNIINQKSNFTIYRTSSALIRLIYSNYELRGYVLNEHKNIEDSIFVYLKKDRPLFIYRYINNRLIPVHYFVDKEKEIYTLYKLGESAYPHLIFSDTKLNAILRKMQKMNYHDMWIFK